MNWLDFNPATASALELEDAQRALKLRDLYRDAIDGEFGPKSRAGMAAAIRQDASAQVSRQIVGDPGWAFRACIIGAHVAVLRARATCFGGDADPQDSGETASGQPTKGHPELCAVSLPMDGREFKGLRPREHAALDGSPIPRVPFNTLVRVVFDGGFYDWPVIDLGPGKRTGNALDLTPGAARRIDPKATARNFEVRCDFFILGAAAIALKKLSLAKN